MGEGSHIYGKRANLESQRAQAAERLWQKSNINGGLTKAQEVALTNWENIHRERATERVVAIDENGRVLGGSTSGTKNRTRMVITPQMKNSVITHNHPRSNLKTGAGTSFSGADISTAIHADAKEIRVVTSDYTYSLRRPKGGWGISHKQARKEWDAAFKSQTAELNKYVFGAKDSKMQLTRIQRANTVGSMQLAREMAKKYGWEFTRKRTK